MLRPRTSAGAIRAVVPALTMTILTATAVFLADYAPPKAGQMAVVFPPFTDELTAWQHVLASGGSIIAPSRFSNIVVVHAPDAGFGSRVRAAGALFTLAAKGLCEPVSSESQSIQR